MAPFELPSMPDSRMSPQLLVGVASPLWGYYGAAAAGGIAYWWMTQWARPVNLGSMLEAVARPAASLAPLVEAAAEPMVEAAEMAAGMAEAVVEATTEAVAEALPAAPIGGEAAPISPLADLDATPTDPDQAPVAAPDLGALVSTETAEPVAASADASPTSETQMIEATADPLPEPATKTRVRKAPSANGLEP